MTIATHITRVNGKFDKNIWNKESLKKYVKNKIFEIEDVLHPDLELFDVKDDNVEVWIYLSALPSEVSQKIVDKWAKEHITEEGLSVTSISIEMIFDKTKHYQNEDFMKVVIT